MYNEVDDLILKSFVECSYCSSKNVSMVGWVTTCMGTGSFDELDGHHEHDPNRIEANYKCNNGHTFDIIPHNSCWCGWTQKPTNN